MGIGPRAGLGGDRVHDMAGTSVPRSVGRRDRVPSVKP